MNGLNWQTRMIPLAAGLQQKADVRALEPPGLLIAKNVQCDELGGLQTRHPMTLLSSIGNVRRVYEYGEELLVFTKTALFSYNAQANEWSTRGTHLAVKVREETTFSTTGDQVDCDRAELSNLIVFAWVDGSNVQVAVKDKSTGATLLAPSSVAGSRPRLVALATKILLFWQDGSGNLVAQAIDPAGDPTDIPSELAAPTTVLAAANFNAYYDVVKQPGADTAVFATRRDTTTAYTIGKVTVGLAVTVAAPARTCDGPIAVSCEPTGTTVQVVRANGTNIQGDRITISSLADAATAQAIGTVAGAPVNQIAACHRSVTQGGEYRCFVFWSAQEAVDATDWTSKFNWVDTGGTLGTQANFVRRLGIASRAFDYNGEVYVHGVFAGESSFSGVDTSTQRASLQNTYFLYRDDAFLVAKIAGVRAGGHQPSTGRLPGVALTSGTTVYSWCATERRIIQVGTKKDRTGYGARAPRDITLTFDSNEARRVAQLGQTLYIVGGELLQYDGAELTEANFHLYPHYFGAVEVPSGNLADGTYTFKVTWRSMNAKGEQDRSTTVTAGNVEIAAGPNGVQIPSWVPLHITHKTSKDFAVEVWRTELNPPLDAPFHLVTSKDPAATSNPNRYIPNAPTTNTLATLNDELADADLRQREQYPHNGAALESISPPAASIIIASDTRLFLAGVAGDPHRVLYSKQRVDGQVAAFHEQLAIDIPRAGGDITALAFLNETLIVFRETAIYAVPGDGFDNLGGGANYGPARLLAGDVGAVSHEAVALTPAGLVFKSSKGWQLLNRGWSVQYIGGKVADYDSDTVVALHVLEGQHQVRVLTTARMLVLDYVADEWFEWTVSDGLHATLWQGRYVYATSTAVKREATDYTGVDYAVDVETAWIKLNGLTGYGAVRWLLALLEWRSASSVRVRLARDYQQTYFDDKIMSDAPSTVGDPWQFRHTPSQKCVEAIKVRLTTCEPAVFATLAAGVDYDTNSITLRSPFGTWSPTLMARAIGTAGNSVTVTVGMKTGTTRSIQVRDHWTWNPVTETWTRLLNNVGVKVVATDDGGASPATAAQIEAAIDAHSELIRVSTAHASPNAEVDMSAMTGLTLTGTLGSTVAGAAASGSNPPSGEAVKFTGLGLELGFRPGLHRNLPTARTQ